MNSIYHDIFRAIHEGKWLFIEYQNKREEITKYWIGIKNLDLRKKSLCVEGLHLGRYVTSSFDCIYIDSIISSKIIEGTFCPVNQRLVLDIYLNPHKYKILFDNTANLKILTYLEMCNRMDTIPYYSDFKLIHLLDRESFQGEAYQLSDIQFKEIVKSFQYKAEEKNRTDKRLKLQQLAINVLSIHTNRGLYVLAYKRLQLDVKRKVLKPEKDITICTQYTLNGTTEHIRKYLDADEYDLLNDFEKNQEKIKNCVTKHNGQVLGVDDMPYIIGLGFDVILDLHSEYEAIIEMYHSDKVTIPIKAFFGDLLHRPIRKKAYPMALINKKINIDQLLAINNAMKYPIAYIQGPPGTGKTNTIINTIVTAFFNEKTVLFSSYNNHPINGIFDKLTNMEYRGKRIMFPILRLGSIDRLSKALDYIKELYNHAKDIPIYESTLDKNRDHRIERAKKLSTVLRKYEDLLDLHERKEALEKMSEYGEKHDLSMETLIFRADLSGRQKENIEKAIKALGEVRYEDVVSLLDDNIEDLKKYLYYTSAKYIQKLKGNKYAELRKIVFETDEDIKVENFTKYLSNTENMKNLQKIFPIIVTTCISAHKLGEPQPIFDMVIMDEASQCNTAVSLVPIIRGTSLMLVGDPQQLNPVILLNEITNNALKKKYHVSNEYDYISNSIYKTYLACDSVSDEVLLRYHYRCHKKIIDFNNKKYYNSQLQIKTESLEEEPLVYVDIENSVGNPQSICKNSAPEEVTAIINYASQYKNKSIGIITPFVNQKNLIDTAIEHSHLNNVSCGTIHSFQGDEKDIILFSTAITDKTYLGTYIWLKNNKELINVATSRAREKLIVFSSEKNIKRLHQQSSEDDLYELIQYVKQNGQSAITKNKTNSRALGVKPFSTVTEEAFLQNLNHAMGIICLSGGRYTVHKEVAIAQVFQNNDTYSDLFYNGRFDFVVYEKQGGLEFPVLAIELDGKEHFEDEIVMQRDKKKNEICRAHHLEIIRVENSYARRYNYIKDILYSYFSTKH